MAQNVYQKMWSTQNVGGTSDAEHYRSTSPPSTQDVKDWEGKNVNLPKDYVDFILKYNGGYLFPQNFHANVDDPTEFVMVDDPSSVDIVLNWELFKEKNEYEDERRERMVAIAWDYHGSEICISIEEHNYGQILYWWRNLSGAWDVEEDGPYPIGVIANNFREFIFEKLFDEDGSAPRWYIPKDLETANIVEF